MLKMKDKWLVKRMRVDPKDDDRYRRFDLASDHFLEQNRTVLIMIKKMSWLILLIFGAKNEDDRH